MNVVKEIQRINEIEINNGSWSNEASWHAQYKNSAWIFAGGVGFDLTEGDLVCIFSQYGEIMHIVLVRDRKTGKSKGFAFLQYEDQRSTVLAVDNLNGANVLGRTLRVDHTFGPKKHKKKDGEEESEDEGPMMNVAPEFMEVGEDEIKEKKKKKKAKTLEDDEDPMAAYFAKKKKSKHHKHSRHKRSTEDRPRREHSTEDRPRREHSTEDRPRRGRSPEDRPRRGRSPEDRPRRGRSPEDRPRRGRSPEDRPRRERSSDRRSRLPSYRSSRDKSPSYSHLHHHRSRSPRL